jgi:hypothetical protein
MEEAIGKLTRQYHRTLAGQEETRQAERNLIPAELKRVRGRISFVSPHAVNNKHQTNLPTDQSHFSADIPNGAGFGGFGEDFPQVSHSNLCCCVLLYFLFPRLISKRLHSITRMFRWTNSSSVIQRHGPLKTCSEVMEFKDNNNNH